VAQEKLNGARDERLYELCIAVRRCLIFRWTSIFADVLRFPPANTQGLMVLRPARVISISL
jgi:hypothetical protein